MVRKLILTSFLLFTLRTAQAADAKKTWALEGTVTEACQCEVFCSCEMNNKPTHGHCDDAEAITIMKGHYGDITLDGQQVILVGASPEGERMVDTIGKLVFGRIYVPDGVSDNVMNSLAQVVRLAFGSLVNQKAQVSPDEKVQRSKIMISSDGRKAEIPNILQMEIEPVTGGDGKTPLVLENSLFTSYGVNDPIIAKSKVYRFSADGFKWDYSGRSASIRTLKMGGDL